MRLVEKDRSIFLYGVSGHARVILDILAENKLEPSLLIDDDPNIKQWKGYSIANSWSDHVGDGGNQLILSIGHNSNRFGVFEKVSPSFLFPVIASRFATISPHATLGDGSICVHGSIIQSNAQIGKQVIVNTKASVDHDCIIKDFAHIAPGATICGGVVVGKGVLIGSGATIVPGVRIGDWAVVGAGSTVLRDVKAGEKAVGLVK
ncbi:MAG: NeuD/PglB/VioB family sugar acetyltransferase [Cyclobacteriaceae bacterium]|nr:NeuD/PglB/VioB family sugar acetyltransferase [Cyclobacteriaceae bacterium]MCH8515571.1 NeuD/PglB/VioB family sugar acetyltransferase [Cyclobacteriaceae bacterium]